MSEDAIKFRCQLCGGQFEPDPRMICYGRFEPCSIVDGACIEDSGITPDDIAEMDDAELVEAGIEPSDRSKMMRGESTTTTLCICLECQDRAAQDESQRES